MARPPKNAEGPSATERMEMAFWDCLKEMPYSDIVVRDIVNRAKVNRNSYYYHYDSMWDLAQASVSHARFTDFARLIMSQKTFSPKGPIREYSDEARRGFESLRLLSSEHGNQRLLETAKESITDEWLAMFGCENVLVSKRTETELDFLCGGITALLARPNLKTLDNLIACIANSEMLLETIKMMRQIIRACEPEKISKAIGSLHPTHEIEEEETEPADNFEAVGAGENPQSEIKEDAESIVERIIEEEMKSEEQWEETLPSDSGSTNEIETQQETEGYDETVSTQNLDGEQEHEDDLPSEESIDDVSPDDASQEIAASAELGQEPVTEAVAEAFVVTEIEVERTIETTRIEEIVIEETATLQTEVQTERIEPAEDAETGSVQEESEMPGISDEDADGADDEPQLTLDIFF